MTELSAFFASPYLYWIAFGCILLSAELLGAAGYMLWLGLSAIIVGVLLVLVPFSWQIQWLTFAALSLMTTYLWWKRQSKADNQDDEQRDLNQKSKQMIGKIVRLEEDVVVGANRIKIGDSTWSAHSNAAITAGSLVKITAMDGILLTIEAVEPPLEP